jgi:hypothetical protein
MKRLFFLLLIGGVLVTNLAQAASIDLFGSDKCDLLYNQLDRFTQTLTERSKVVDQSKDKQLQKVVAAGRDMATQYAETKQQRLAALEQVASNLRSLTLTDTQKQAVDTFVASMRAATEQYFAQMIVAQQSQQTSLNNLVAKRNAAFVSYQAKRDAQVSELVARIKSDCAKTLKLSVLKTQFKEQIRLIESQEKDAADAFTDVRKEAEDIIRVRKEAQRQAFDAFKRSLDQAKALLDKALGSR